MMGLNQSRQLEKQLNEACTKADRVGSNRISKFLGETFITSAAAAVDDLEHDDAFAQQIAAELKKLARKRSSSEQTSPHEGAKRRALKCASSFDTQITLQPAIKQCLISWVTSISSFFEDNEGLSFDPQLGTSGQVYRLLCHLERRNAVDCVRRRILLTALHKLLEKFRRQRVHDKVFESLVSAVFQSGLAGTDIDAIRRNLVDWTKKGKRYSTFGDHLGGPGSIMLLPYDIGDSIWEHVLPMKGQVHDEMIENLQQRGIQTEASKEWNTPMPQPEGWNITGPASVQTVVQKILDTILRDLVWVVSPTATAGHPVTDVVINHASQAVTHQEIPLDTLASPPTDLRAPPVSFPNVAATVANSPVPQPQCSLHEQSHQSSASHLPSLQHIMNPIPLEPSSRNLVSGGHTDQHTSNTGGMTMDATTCQGFGHLDQASIRNTNPLPGVPRSFSSQPLQNAGRQDLTPNPHGRERTFESYISTAETSNFSPATYLGEGIGREYAPLPPDLENGLTSLTEDHISFFPNTAFTGLNDDHVSFFPNPAFTGLNDDHVSFFPNPEVGLTTSAGYDGEGFAQQS